MSPDLVLLVGLAAQLAEAERDLCVSVGGEPMEDPRPRMDARQDDPRRVDVPQVTIH